MGFTTNGNGWEPPIIYQVGYGRFMAPTSYSANSWIVETDFIQGITTPSPVQLETWGHQSTAARHGGWVPVPTRSIWAIDSPMEFTWRQSHRLMVDNQKCWWRCISCSKPEKDQRPLRWQQQSTSTTTNNNQRPQQPTTTTTPNCWSPHQSIWRAMKMASDDFSQPTFLL